jgi:hypothetical protein
MSKNFAFFSIGSALLFSLFLVGVGHAIQIDLKKQTQLKGTASSLATQVSSASRPCGGRNGAACRTYIQRESGEKKTEQSRYATTPMMR